ncbi:MAG: hypothetical protein VCC04_05765, partial [Myxococcota bacterium]
HNRRYWRREPILGLGVGAHSADPPSAAEPHGRRRANPRDRSIWSERVRAGEGPAPHGEALSKDEAMSEACFLSLRTDDGLDAQGFATEFDHPPRHYFGEAIDRLIGDALLEEEADGGLKLSEKGRLLADTVAAEFVFTGD